MPNAGSSSLRKRCYFRNNRDININNVNATRMKYLAPSRALGAHLTFLAFCRLGTAPVREKSSVNSLG